MDLSRLPVLLKIAAYYPQPPYSAAPLVTSCIADPLLPSSDSLLGVPFAATKVNSLPEPQSRLHFLSGPPHCGETRGDFRLASALPEPHLPTRRPSHRNSEKYSGSWIASGEGLSLGLKPMTQHMVDRLESAALLVRPLLRVQVSESP